MQIKTASMIGLGALGILFGRQISKNLPEGDFTVIADDERVKRYRAEGIFCNGERCDFRFIAPREAAAPVDLLIFTVKATGLPLAIQDARSFVGERTTVLSLLNGISSERHIGEVYGFDKLLYSVAQGMDAVKTANHLTYSNMGMICFGAPEGASSGKVGAAAEFFDRTGIPYQIEPDIRRRMWAKWMLNVGVNQASAVYRANYGVIQLGGFVRQRIIAAMREVILLAGREGIDLTERDIDYSMGLIDSLNPEGKSSMQQDIEAKRFSEVDLFSGEALRLAEKHGVDTPVLRELYEQITGIERAYRREV